MARLVATVDLWSTQRHVSAYNLLFLVMALKLPGDMERKARRGEVSVVVVKERTGQPFKCLMPSALNGDGGTSGMKSEHKGGCNVTSRPSMTLSCSQVP